MDENSINFFENAHRLEDILDLSD